MALQLARPTGVVQIAGGSFAPDSLASAASWPSWRTLGSRFVVESWDEKDPGAVGALVVEGVLYGPRKTRSQMAVE